MWAQTHDPNSPWGILERLQKATAERSEVLKSNLPEPRFWGAEWRRQPSTTEYPSRGFQYEGYGTDLALEICYHSWAAFHPALQAKFQALQLESPMPAIGRFRAIIWKSDWEWYDESS